MATKSYTKEQVKEYGEAQRLVPGEKEVAAAGFKIERTYRPDGSYSWRAPFKPNDGGKLTADGAKCLELTRAGREAHERRMSKINAATEREKLKSADGRTQYVDADMAESVARRNGWGHKIAVGGSMVRRYAVVDGEVVQVSGPE